MRKQLTSAKLWVECSIRYDASERACVRASKYAGSHIIFFLDLILSATLCVYNVNLNE